MMLIPKKSETLVLPTPAQELLVRLNDIVLKSDESNKDEVPFTGTIDENAFVIALKLKRADNFIPLINGNIEQTSKGSIVFLKYTLFKSTRMFLVFWTALIFVLAIVLIILQSKFWYGSLALLVSVANYAITVINFRRKVKTSREHLMRIFF